MLSPKKEKKQIKEAEEEIIEENPNLLKPSDMYDMSDIYKIIEDKKNLIDNEQNTIDEDDEGKHTFLTGKNHENDIMKVQNGSDKLVSSK